jgi:murein DD-endopeptidase MepM/ murein hydrolase activator NlpD
VRAAPGPHPFKGSAPASDIQDVRPAAAAILVVALAFPASATSFGSSRVAALQVALKAKRLYTGTIDGVAGPATTGAVRRFQERVGLPADGIVGPATRRKLGRRGLPELGRRPLELGATGWDVARLQFLLAWHGFPSARFDGRFGPHVERAVLGFQRRAGLAADGIAGAGTIRSLLRAPLPRVPISLVRPVDAPVGDGFGPRGDSFHAGIDLVAGRGAPVASAAAGRVAYAGWLDGFGRLVVLAHGHGVRTFYAHLARIDVRVGRRVTAGERLGLVGSTGDASGPHLHFEVRVRGAAADPLPALGP